jgi:hypothetical protein
MIKKRHQLRAIRGTGCQLDEWVLMLTTKTVVILIHLVMM